MWPSGRVHLYSDTGIARTSWGMLLARRHGLPQLKHSMLLHSPNCTMMNMSRYARHKCRGLTACSTSFVASTAGYNGDRESDYSVSTTGHVVCLVASPVFILMPQRDTASQKTFPVGEVWTGAHLEPSLITGKENLLVTIDTKSFEHAIGEVLLILCWWQTRTTV